MSREIWAKTTRAPFEPKETILCIQRSPEITIFGREVGMCECVAWQVYTIDRCTYISGFGWAVSITGELHAAKDFCRLPIGFKFKGRWSATTGDWYLPEVEMKMVEPYASQALNDHHPSRISTILERE